MAREFQLKKKTQTELRGWVDLYNSNPDYSSTFYGKLVIPIELVEQAMAQRTRKVKGQECVELKVTLYDFDGDWQFESTPPAFKGKISLR